MYKITIRKSAGAAIISQLLTFYQHFREGRGHADLVSKIKLCKFVLIIPE
jgi:hypothetical protein